MGQLPKFNTENENPKPTNEVHILALYLLHLSFLCLTISVRNYCARLEGKKRRRNQACFGPRKYRENR